MSTEYKYEIHKSTTAPVIKVCQQLAAIAEFSLHKIERAVRETVPRTEESLNMPDGEISRRLCADEVRAELRNKVFYEFARVYEDEGYFYDDREELVREFQALFQPWIEGRLSKIATDWYREHEDELATRMSAQAPAQAKSDL